ncbi:SAM-dependent methyltransferase [Streptomyces sp. NPDC059679]|uniref:SAM-dependent methyltransferase n=1 Tax=Streptomyces sp. NPDC059679 TaxID=3346903 RepID=UPI0036BC1F5E
MRSIDSVNGAFRQSVDVRTDVPHSARMYDYYLGGKDNYEVDRAAAEKVVKVFPNIRTAARANREFLGRAVRYLSAEQGVQQFLDIGTGIPASGNTHEIAQEVTPCARIVYVDNDPIVLAHAAALLISNKAGATAYIDADLRDPGSILADPELTRVLDLRQPVGLLLVAILHFIQDGDDPWTIVSTLLDALPVGSYLVVTHATGDFAPGEWAKIQSEYRSSGISAQVRSHVEVSRFFTGLEMVSPGLQVVSRWRPNTVPSDPDFAVSCYGAVARKR